MFSPITKDEFVLLVNAFVYTPVCTNSNNNNGCDKIKPTLYAFSFIIIVHSLPKLTWIGDYPVASSTFKLTI